MSHQPLPPLHTRSPGPPLMHNTKRSVESILSCGQRQHAAAATPSTNDLNTSPPLPHTSAPPTLHPHLVTCSAGSRQPCGLRDHVGGTPSNLRAGRRISSLPPGTRPWMRSTHCCSSESDRRRDRLASSSARRRSTLRAMRVWGGGGEGFSGGGGEPEGRGGGAEGYLQRLASCSARRRSTLYGGQG